MTDANVDVQHDQTMSLPEEPKVSDFTPFMQWAAIPLIIAACFSVVYAVYLIAPVVKPGDEAFKDISGLLVGFQSTCLLVLMSLGWVVSMGCIGAIASLDMQAIKGMEGKSVPDIKSLPQVILRVSLGGVFALALTFPWESDCFTDLCYSMGTGRSFKGDEGVSLRALVLILPFLLGFSTPLVMSIINQLNAAVLSFFGQLGPGTKGGVVQNT